MAAGADRVVEVLAEGGVSTVFGIPGVHTLPLYDALRRDGRIRHILTRHEQAAAFAADGYARISRRPGVCIATTGPGVFNAMTGLAEAYADSSPVLLLGGQVEAESIGLERGILHETADQAGAFTSVVGFSSSPRSAGALADAVSQALGRTMCGRPRPAFVELPTDLLLEDAPAVDSVPPVPRRTVPASDIEQVAAILLDARRRAILAGSGVVRAAASAPLTRLAERLDAPVLTTVPGNGAIPADHELWAGTIHPRLPSARLLLEQVDVLLVVGCRLDAGTTDRWQLPLPPIVQLDIDPSVIGRNYRVRHAVIADAGDSLAALVDALSDPVDAQNWGPPAAALARRRLEASVCNECSGELAMMRGLRQVLSRDTVVTNDAATINSWTAYFWPVLVPGTYLFPWGSAALGFALPAAIGASIASPSAPSLAVCGDGGFLYTAAELATCVRYGLNVTVLCHNDSRFGSIAAYQRAQFGEEFEVELRNPDLTDFARSFGVRACRVERLEDVPDAVAGCVGQPGPALVELRAPLRNPWPIG